MSIQHEREQAREISRLKAYIQELENASAANADECVRLEALLSEEKKRANAAVRDLAKIYQIALRAHEDCALADVIELAWDIMCYVPMEARGVQNDNP